MKLNINIRDICVIKLECEDVNVYLKGTYYNTYYKSGTKIATMKIQDLLELDFTNIMFKCDSSSNSIRFEGPIFVKVEDLLEVDGFKHEVISLYKEYIEPRREEIRLEKHRIDLAYKMLLDAYEISDCKDELDELGIKSRIEFLIREQF